MSVVGIDLGAQSTKIGVARNKGIDIVSVAPRAQQSRIVTISESLPIADRNNGLILTTIVGDF